MEVLNAHQVSLSRRPIKTSRAQNKKKKTLVSNPTPRTIHKSLQRKIYNRQPLDILTKAVSSSTLKISNLPTQKNLKSQNQPTQFIDKLKHASLLFKMNTIIKLKELQIPYKSICWLSKAFLKLMKEVDNKVTINSEDTNRTSWRNFLKYLSTPGHAVQKIRQLSEFIMKDKISTITASRVCSDLNKCMYDDLVYTEGAEELYNLIRLAIKAVQQRKEGSKKLMFRKTRSKKLKENKGCAQNKQYTSQQTNPSLVDQSLVIDQPNVDQSFVGIKSVKKNEIVELFCQQEEKNQFDDIENFEIKQENEVFKKPFKVLSSSQSGFISRRVRKRTSRVPFQSTINFVNDEDRINQYIQYAKAVASQSQIDIMNL